LPDLNLRLRPTILAMKPGTRVVSHAFTMGDWEADKEIDAGSKGYFWIVPANVAGDWEINGIEVNGKGVLSLSQRYQRIGGNLTIGNKSQPILNPILEGDKLSFGYLDRKNNLHSVKLTVSGGQFKGEDKSGSTFSEVIGKRR